MIKLGITGGIGSGKTIVCKVFEKLGVPIFNADIVAKIIVDTDADLIVKIKKEFGITIYNSSGLDREKMSKIVFSDTSSLKKLNTLIHPIVAKEFMNWQNNYMHLPYVIKEAAILFESGAYREMDKVVTVFAPENIRIKRVMERDNVDEEMVKKRISNQMNEDEKAKLSDYIIINDESELVVPQILKIHNELKRK